MRQVDNEIGLVAVQDSLVIITGESGTGKEGHEKGAFTGASGKRIGKFE
jgi:transcriptional regulator with GAF, ATPase, and Fis domain